MTETVEAVGNICAASLIGDVIVHRLVECVITIAVVINWVARLHDAASEEMVISAIVGGQMPAYGARPG